MTGPFDLTGKRRAGTRKAVGAATVDAATPQASPGEALAAADKQPPEASEPEREMTAMPEPTASASASRSTYTPRPTPSPEVANPRPSQLAAPREPQPRASEPSANERLPRERKLLTGPALPSTASPVDRAHHVVRRTPSPRPAAPHRASEPEPAWRDRAEAPTPRARAVEPARVEAAAVEAHAEDVASSDHDQLAGLTQSSAARSLRERPRGPTAGRAFQARGQARRATTLTLSVEAADALEALADRKGLSKAAIASMAILQLHAAEDATASGKRDHEAASTDADDLLAALATLLGARKKSRR